jgi:CubicO group peptidase (beta-lactamase class C family)
MKCIPTIKDFVLLILIIFIALTCFCPYVTSSQDYYPTQSWQTSTPEAQGIPSELLLEMLQHIKLNEYNLQSVSIVRNGYLVLDAYLHPFQDGQKHQLHSITKSVVSALIGIAIDKGYLKNVNQKIAELFPHKKIAHLDAQKRSVTLQDLLIMGSGFDCRDASENYWAGTIAMKKSNNWTQYTLNLPMAQPPGEYFHYCNGVSHLLSAIIQESTGMMTMAFARKHLFDPLGIKDIGWEVSPEGTNNGYAGLQLKPRDMAKIGLLYLNGGKWENKQIISTQWIEASTRPYLDGKWAGEDYGYQWWVNPAGFFSAIGMYGQAIYVVPEKNLVVVFTGDIRDKDMYISGTLLKEHIVPAMRSTESLPPNPDTKSQLDNLVAELAAAPEQGLIWVSQEEGVARDGIFKRTASPGLKFAYPPGSKKAETRAQDQIMRMQTAAGNFLTASLIDIPRNWKRFFMRLKLEEFGPVAYTSWLGKYGSDINVLSNTKLTMKCGTPAYRTDIKWLFNRRVPMTTMLLSSYRGDQCIYICVHQSNRPENVDTIIDSFTFYEKLSPE